MTLTWHTTLGEVAQPRRRTARRAPCRAGDVVLGDVRRGLARNPRRTLAATVGIILGIGLFSRVLFFSDASVRRSRSGPCPARAGHAVGAHRALGRGLRFDERLVGPSRLERRQQVRLVLTIENEGAVPANDVVIRDEAAASTHLCPRHADGQRQAGCRHRGQSPLAHGPARTVSQHRNPATSDRHPRVRRERRRTGCLGHDAARPGQGLQPGAGRSGARGAPRTDDPRAPSGRSPKDPGWLPPTPRRR